MTVALEMVLPGLLGLWIDSKLGTRVLFGCLGFAVGLTSGMWHLLRMTSSGPNGRGRHSARDASPPSPSPTDSPRRTEQRKPDR